MQPEMTPFEQHLHGSYSVLEQARNQCNLMHAQVIECVAKCMDTDDLFTRRRATMPIRHRLNTDQEEKTCVANCGAKYEALYQRVAVKLNQREMQMANLRMMMEGMAAQGAPAE